MASGSAGTGGWCGYLDPEAGAGLRRERGDSADAVRATWQRRAMQGAPVLDVIYIGLTIVVFASLWLLVKGVERFER